MSSRLVTIITFLLLLATAALTACGGPSAGTSASELKLAPKSALPDFVRDAPPQVQEAYQFAVANPGVLEKMPCYCGCGNMGHQNNLECYVAEFAPDGNVAQFDNHAFG